MLLCAIAVVACGDKRGTPFAVKVTPALRAAVAEACADPVHGSDIKTEVPGAVQSQGRCYLRLDLEEDTQTITRLVFGGAESFARAEKIMREIIMPLLTPEMRRFIEERVLADLGADKTVDLDRPGRAEIHFRNRSLHYVDDDLRPIPSPNLLLTIEPR